MQAVNQEPRMQWEVTFASLPVKGVGTTAFYARNETLLSSLRVDQHPAQHNLRFSNVSNYM